MRKVLLGLLLFAFSVHTAFAVAIVLDDGSTFEVELVAHGAGSYTYQVSEVADRDLSHWLLEFGVCAEHLIGASPDGYELGLDGGTGYTGIKWDVTDEFSSGLFTVTLDAEYPVGPVLALVKAGNTHAVAYVDGPLCSVQPPPDDPQPEDPTPTPTETPDLPELCREELPQLEYLGSEATLHTLPDGFDYFIVKRNSPFSFDVVAGPTYDNAAGRRLWACKDGNCLLPAVYHDAVDLGHFQAGATISLAIIDDDIDDRLNWWALDDPMTAQQVQEQQGMVVYTSLTVPMAGNWYYYASDSVGLYVTCQQPPPQDPEPTPTNTLPPTEPAPTHTPEPTPTSVCEPDMVRIGDSCVTLTPTPTTQPNDPTPTLAPPVTITVEPPPTTPAPTLTPTNTPTTTPTLIPPISLTPPTATPTPTVPPTNEEDGPEPVRWFTWAVPVHNWCDPATHQYGCGN